MSQGRNEFSGNQGPLQLRVGGNPGNEVGLVRSAKNKVFKGGTFSVNSGM